MKKHILIVVKKIRKNYRTQPLKHLKHDTLIIPVYMNGCSVWVTLAFGTQLPVYLLVHGLWVQRRNVAKI